MRKTTQFKNLLYSGELEFLLEAHNGVSAKIVEEAGFKAVWASGLSIAAAMGVRDSNEASWTQVLETVEFMSDATSIPILMDADTGYGNFNNMRRLVRKLEQRDIPAVCIEDKTFPKANSFAVDHYKLADVLEFAGKIRAAKDTQKDSDFCVVARVEALIAERSMSEALDRAWAYYEAGADAILIHSKHSEPDQILDFMRQWHCSCPVAILPTTYYKTPAQVFREARIRLLICANHLLRSSVAAMKRLAATIWQEQSLQSAEDQIVSLQEIFRLQNVFELLEAERRYLSTTPEDATCRKNLLLNVLAKSGV